MNTEKLWTSYVLHNLDERQIDKILINLKCDIPGYRLNNKSLKKAPLNLKIGTISKVSDIEKEIIQQVKLIYKDMIGNEAIEEYLKIPLNEFLEGIEEFKETQEKATILCVINSLLDNPAIMTSEKNTILEHFERDNCENNIITENKTVEQNSIPIVEEVPEQATSSKKNKQTKIVTHLYKESLEKNQKLEQEIQNLNLQLKTQEQELQKLQILVEENTRNQEVLTNENKDLISQLERIKVEKNMFDLPYLFIGSEFIRQKVDILKLKYPNIKIHFISTSQWKSGLGKTKSEVSEVYIFFYDTEWLIRNNILQEYQEKLKIFSTDTLFSEYIKEYWEGVN